MLKKILNEEILLYIMLAGASFGTLTLLLLQVPQLPATVYLPLPASVEDIRVTTLPEVIVRAPRRIASVFERSRTN
ncbi:MAG: hypothetical protein H7Y22_04960 [Gemmatimonadaceae bacterium]|nr:hypothetical protein [Gloeobacterales cyanobacterium ES-bin-141]